MDARRLYQYFALVEKGARGMGQKADEMFRKKAMFAKDLDQDPSIYFNMNLSARNHLISLIKEEEAPFWRKLEKSAKRFLKVANLKPLEGRTPKSFAQGKEAADCLVNAKGILGQIKANVNEQLEALGNVRTKEDMVSIKIFNQKFNEQRHLYAELMQNRSKALTEATNVAKSMREELIKFDQACKKREEVGDNIKAAGLFFLGFAVLAGFGNSLSLNELKEFEFHFERFIASLLAIGLPAAAIATIGAEVEKESIKMRGSFL